mmetsp:Transcript_79282/g.227456  ORF Transcript_79282/g.227456 Transcript_79282/m.227456 type:complete len:222 (-) Transcript_79282:220-885(-)
MSSLGRCSLAAAGGMVVVLPSQPISHLSEDAEHKLKYVRICTLGIWVCALGRWADGNTLGAANDLFSGAFGTCIFQDDLSAVFNLPQNGGAQCLFPFALLSAINAFFDIMSLVLVCPECFKSYVIAFMPECSGCFFTLGAAVFQTSGSVLSWQIHRSASRDIAYGDIRAAGGRLAHADFAEEGEALIERRTGIGLSAGTAASAREIATPHFASAGHWAAGE